MFSASNTALDELDLGLLAALQRNGRSTYAELAALIGLKTSAVHDRVKRLEARGFIRGYGARIEARRVGLNLIAFVAAYTAPDALYQPFVDAVSALPEVCEIHSVAGDESYLLKVITRSTDHLDDFLTRLKAIPGMARSRTTVVLSTPFERDGIAVDSISARDVSPQLRAL